MSLYELDRKVENQKRIWDEKVQRELVRQNKEQMKAKAEKLTKIDENKIDEYKNIARKVVYTKWEKMDMDISTKKYKNSRKCV